MGSDDSAKATDSEEGSIGAGGMMAQFFKYTHFHLPFSQKVVNEFFLLRDTEDIRSASSLAFGLVIQYLTTAVVALIPAFRVHGCSPW